VAGVASGLSGDRADTLLLYLASGDDAQRFAVGPALAAAAERAGWAFECYYDALRRGRHHGGGDPGSALPGATAGSLVAGGRHADRAARLCALYETVVVGDPASPLWPPLERASAAALARSTSPSELYAATLERLGLPVPELALVLDGAPQGPHGIVTAPFLYPALLAGPPALALDVSSAASEREALERLGVRRFEALGVAPDRAAGFPGDLAANERIDVGAGWAQFTADAARRDADWGRGVLLGDPEVVAAQLPKARRLRLLPLHGRPQTEAIRASEDLIQRGAEPVYGRQWDDRDFFELAAAGHGLQVVDPGPPFDAAGAAGQALPDSPGDDAEGEPDDAQLERWATEGRVLVTLLLWSGMLRELDCLPRLVDLAALTDLRAGLVLTAETFEHGADEALELLTVAPKLGGLLGRLEPVLGSTGRGVAAEAYLGADRLAAYLAESLAAIERRAPAALRPRGWWPLLDAQLVKRREAPVEIRGVRPVVRFRPRAGVDGPDSAAEGAAPPPVRRDFRALVGRSVRATGLDALLEQRRPYDGWRPGELDDAIVEAVRGAGFDYMWTKAGHGDPRVLRREGDFVVLPFTAGAWDGWSPFYTVGDAAAVFRAERRLLRRRPGWLASTVDSPLFALSGEVWPNGARLHELARVVAAGGRSGELVNVTPGVLARYARLLHDRAGAESAV
jgi:hypothetical protein